MDIHSFVFLKKGIGVAVFALCSALLAAGGSPDRTQSAAAGAGTGFSEHRPVKVFVTIGPQRYFVERIGGTRVTVEVLVAPGRDPHTFDPSPRQVSRLSSADVYFTIGMPFEKGLVPKLRQANPLLPVIDTLAGLDLLYGVPHYHYDEAGNAILHGADEPDTHVWLGLREVRSQIAVIRDALIARDPAGEEVYRTRWQAFDNEIQAMDSRFAGMLAPLRGRSILVFHPAFAYFVNSYGIRQLAIELEGKQPSPRHLERIIDQALRDGARTVFTQSEFPLRSAEIIAQAVGGTVIVLNPLDPDWMQVMETLASAIAAGAF